MSSGCLSAAFWLCSWSRNLLHNLRKDKPVNPISGLHTSGSLGFAGAGSQCHQERENVKGTASQYIPGPSPKIQIRASSPAALSLSAFAKSEPYFRLQLAHPSCDSFFNCLPLLKIWCNGYQLASRRRGECLQAARRTPWDSSG